MSVSRDLYYDIIDKYNSKINEEIRIQKGKGINQIMLQSEDTSKIAFSFMDIPVDYPGVYMHICGVGLFIDSSGKVTDGLYLFKRSASSKEMNYFSLSGNDTTLDWYHQNWKIFSYAAICYYHVYHRFPSSFSEDLIHPDMLSEE